MQFSFHSGTDTDGSRSTRSLPVSPWIIPAAIAAILLLMAVIFHFVAGSVAREADLLAAEGVEVLATVMDSRVQETEERTRDSDGFSRTETKVNYYLALSFEIADGTSVEVEKSVNAPMFNRYGKGDTLPIHYAASDPTVTEFEKGSRAGDASVFKWLSRVLGAVGVLLVGIAVYLRRKLAVQL